MYFIYCIYIYIYTVYITSYDKAPLYIFDHLIILYNDNITDCIASWWPLDDRSHVKKAKNAHHIFRHGLHHLSRHKYGHVRICFCWAALVAWTINWPLEWLREDQWDMNLSLAMCLEQVKRHTDLSPIDACRWIHVTSSCIQFWGKQLKCQKH